jgi:hypothetical protein
MDGRTDMDTKGALFVDEYRHIKDWSSAFDLEISLPKCVEIVITKVRASKPLVVAELDDIKRVEIVKLLGITFNCRLSFAAHIDSTLSSVSQQFYLLKQLKWQGLDMNGLNVVFNALVLSKLLYGSQAFSGFLLESELDHIQAVLNKAIRWGLTTRLEDIRNYIVVQITGCLTKFAQTLVTVLVICCLTSVLHITFICESMVIIICSLSLHTALHKSSYVPRCLFGFVFTTLLCSILYILWPPMAAIYSFTLWAWPRFFGNIFVPNCRT